MNPRTRLNPCADERIGQGKLAVVMEATIEHIMFDGLVKFTCRKTTRLRRCKSALRLHLTWRPQFGYTAITGAANGRDEVFQGLWGLKLKSRWPFRGPGKQEYLRPPSA